MCFPLLSAAIGNPELIKYKKKFACVRYKIIKQPTTSKVMFLTIDG